MRSYRFFLRHTESPAVFSKGTSTSPCIIFEKDEPEIFFQLLTVLRARAQDEIVLLQNQMREYGHHNVSHQSPVEFGLEYHFQIEQINKKSMSVLFTGTTNNTNELKIPLELIICLPNKPDKLELILQKSVELGVSSIVLVEGDFSQMKHTLRPDRLEKIMIEAAEQSERAMVPSLQVGKKLIDFLGKNKLIQGATPSELAKAHQKANIWVAMERLDVPNLANLTENYLKKNLVKNVGEKFKHENISSKISLVIGPEGGFSEAEKSFIAKDGLTCFSLGQRILRMETAAIVSLGIVSQYFS